MAPPWFPLINFTIEKEFSKHFSGNSNFVQDLLHSAPLLSEDFPRNSRFLPEPLVEGIPSPADSKCPGDGYYHIGNKSGVEKTWCTVVPLVLFMICLGLKAVGLVEAAMTIYVNTDVNCCCREDKEPTKGPIAGIMEEEGLLDHSQFVVYPCHAATPDEKS